MAIRILILERHALFGEAIRSALLDAEMDVLDVIPQAGTRSPSSNKTSRMCS
jgi:hypothetical protein